MASAAATSKPGPIWTKPEWEALKAEATAMGETHLRELLDVSCGVLHLTQGRLRGRFAAAACNHSCSSSRLHRAPRYQCSDAGP